MQAGATRTSRRKYLPQPSAAAHTARTPGEGRQEDIHMKKLFITEEEKALLEAFRKSKRKAEFIEALNRLSKSQVQECGVCPKEQPATA